MTCDPRKYWKEGFFSAVISIILLLIIIIFPGCVRNGSEGKIKPAYGDNSHLFTLLSPEKTGIRFENTVVDGEKFNILTFRNYYNGAGVAIGDINNDSLPDIYFTANQEKNRLYLNKGNFVFEDITDKAGVGGKMAWCTGVTMADVNGDGFLDIYVCNSGNVDPKVRKNELFINNGDLTFTERAKEYNLDNDRLSVHAAFFDYDLDGDLDCYIMNNYSKNPSRIELYKKMREVSKIEGDKLMRNDGGIFHDVTEEAGIFSSDIGFGNGIGIADLNNDNLPDIYVANDFWERDYMYINKGNGKFSEEFIPRFNYCSLSSMGGDIADVNNDGNMDVFTTDMLPADNFRIQTTIAFDPYHVDDQKYRENFYYQETQNCLHINDGTAHFQEIGFMAGISATDWSWGATIFDFENDGNKDIFISNGIFRDIMDRDALDFYQDKAKIKNIVDRNGRFDYRDFIPIMPSQPLQSYAFHNNGTLIFHDVAETIGFGDLSFSNGAAYGDLDNDGDQDLVVNNVNSPCFIYRNDTDSKTGNHYLKVKFNGPDGNPFGIGAIVSFKINGETRVMQNFNSKGFESSVEPDLIFGLGNEEKIDHLQVKWPDGKVQVVSGIKANQTLTLHYGNASVPESTEVVKVSSNYEEVGQKIINGNARHVENTYNDFQQEILLTNVLSTEGPELIAGDVNNDRLDDFILLGAAGDPDKLFIQQSDGTFRFRDVPSFRKDKGFESTCGALVDLDRDGNPDLLIGSGGNDVLVDQLNYIVRVYKNDGHGNFTGDPYSIPPVIGNFSTIKVSDFNKDGINEIFLGARLVPGNYGLPPQSYLLRFDGNNWSDLAPESLGNVGMVTDAAWADADGDGDNDLVVVGDWMPVHIFLNDRGRLADPVIIPESSGWWMSMEAADLDKDGDTDFVLGNWGLNTKFKASPAKPLALYVSDFDNNGKSEFILDWYPPLDSIPYPFVQRQEILAQLPGLLNIIPTYKAYGHMTYDSLFSPNVRQKAKRYDVDYLQSAVLWNEGGGKYTLSALPLEAQVSPVFAILTGDFDGDGVNDLWLGGNFYGLKPQVGRHDTSKGVLLKGIGERKFLYQQQHEDGFWVRGEVRDAAIISSGNTKRFFIARNNDRMLVFQRTTK
jgi:hypothetical protein